MKFTVVFLFLFLIFAGTANAQVESLISPKDTSEIFSIDEINVQLHKTEDMILRLNNRLNALKYASIDSAFTKKTKMLDREAEDFNAYDPQNLSKFFLNNIYLVWANYRIQIEKWQKLVDADLNVLLGGMEQVDRLQKQWKANLEMLKQRDLPSLENRVYQVMYELNSLDDKLKKVERDVVSLQTKITDKLFLCDQIITKTNNLQERLRNKTLSRTDKAIWNIQLHDTYEGSLWDRISKAWSNNYRSAQYYFSSIGTSVIGYIIWALLIIAGVLILRKVYILLKYDARIPGHLNVERVLIQHPYSIIISTLLLLWSLFFPYIPLLLSDAIFLSIIISLSNILFRFINHTGKWIVYTIITLLVLNIFELVYWYLGDYVRLYLFFESGFALVVVSYFWLRLRKTTPDKDTVRVIKLARKIVPVLIILYAISFIGNIFGFINLSVLLNKISIRTIAVSMIAFGYLRIFNSLVFAILQVIGRKYPSFLMRYNDKITKRSASFIGVIVFLLWFRSFLTILEIREEFLNMLVEFLTTEMEIGSISVSLANILLFIFILSVTYAIAVFIKKIIEQEILQNLKLPRGIPAAISMVLRIFFVTLGVIFAISAAGIDMGKFGMIAGALGVGIGFGLQNIVQNFISGLILIFERPIQVGDTVEVNNLLGQVKDIGVRASNVVTYDGAEVVVPNSNLISNDLINWTLSDSRKRVEIKVGAAYGTDPNKVLEILKNAASNHPNVVKNPEPRALFEGFGDSSLDFRLLFWVNFELGLGTKSDIAIEIYNKFAEEGIEIPFPQVDVHMKEGPKGENGELTAGKPEELKAETPEASQEKLVDKDSGEGENT
jgi:small-conductance mechanosensitive channel